MKEILAEIISKYNLENLEFKPYSYNKDATLLLNDERLATILRLKDRYTVVTVLIVGDKHITNEFIVYDEEELGIVVNFLYQKANLEGWLN